jgi:glutathione synthase
MAADDLRSNMARGGTPKETDPAARGLLAGIEVIGDRLAEIGVTAPGGIRAIKNVGRPDIAAMASDKVEAKRHSGSQGQGRPRLHRRIGLRQTMP